MHYVLRRWLDKKWIAGLQFRNCYHLAMVMDEDADSLREGQVPRDAPETRNPRPETRDPKPETLPKTRNPTP